MNTLQSYTPYAYRRVCDICGVLHTITDMFRKGPYTICSDHVGERINEELDRGNAAQRPFRVLPVPNAKPDDPIAPDVFEAEESTTWALLDVARPAGARYAQVASGMVTALPNANDVIPVNAWACRHYYELALLTYPTGHQNLWTAQCLVRLRTAADVLLARQSTTGTRATNSYYGGLLATGSSYYFSENTSTSGLAFLYAYRLLGDIKYLAAARACANFLRNLQAIGSNGVNFTSSDAAGLARLYTGGITNAAFNGAGFFSDHAFYPSSLLALQFWNELKLTDGDQVIGATAAIAGDFSTIPSALLSTCMGDLQTFWEEGVFDATYLDVRTGLSASTPSECFNAYPQSKSNFPPGDGSWDYQDGFAGAGTTITALNFAKALSALYAVDGLSDQVTTLDDYLQGFTSNSTYETADDTSPRDLARATTGTYDPSVSLAKYLLVRDPTTLAATKLNASSLYDWGAFGLMAPIWSRRRTLAFKRARAAACQDRRRLDDGLPSDGFWDDRGFQRGRQGLTWQTAFTETLEHGAGALP